MSESAKKWWKLAFIAVPIVVSNLGSYAKARAESKDESKASYEAMSKAFAEMKQNADEDHDHIAALEGQLAILKDMVARSSRRTNFMPSPPEAKMLPIPLMTPDAGVRDTDGDGIADAMAPPKPFKHRPHNVGAALPANFDDVVQQYKAKK